METTLSGFLTGVSKQVGGGGHHKGATCYCKMKQDIATYPVAGNSEGWREGKLRAVLVEGLSAQSKCGQGGKAAFLWAA